MKRNITAFKYALHFEGTSWNHSLDPGFEPGQSHPKCPQRTRRLEKTPPISSEIPAQMAVPTVDPRIWSDSPYYLQIPINNNEWKKISPYFKLLSSIPIIACIVQLKEPVMRSLLSMTTNLWCIRYPSDVVAAAGDLTKAPFDRNLGTDDPALHYTKILFSILRHWSFFYLMKVCYDLS